MNPRRRHRFFFLVFSLSSLQCADDASGSVRTGAQVLLAEHLSLLEGRRVGLITNQTGRLPEGPMLVDTLLRSGVSVTALLAPEHGIRGTAAAGEAVSDNVDPLTGIPVYSLHGSVRKPTPEMLREVDVLLYDLQDVGVRFYTYITTMGLAMEAAAESGIPFIVLDRPNPLGGLRVEGPLLEDSLASFLGKYPIPVIYGLTCGELARMIIGEGWIEPAPDLTVIPMNGWQRAMQWEETGLSWIPPSPNIPRPSTVAVYPATCFIEATNLSEGRGTGDPFHLIGAPFVNAAELSSSLNGLEIAGVSFLPFSFTPTSSKHANIRCGGVRLQVTTADEFMPVLTGFRILTVLLELYVDSLTINRNSLGRLLGSAEAVDQIMGGEREPGDALGRGVTEFMEQSAEYRFY